MKNLIPLLSLTLIISPYAVATQTPSITQDKSSTVVIQVNKDEVIANTGDYLNQLPTKSKPKNKKHPQYKEIWVGKSLEITANKNGTILVQMGDGTLVYEINKKAVEQLGIAKESLGLFFSLVQYSEAPVAEWHEKLKEVAEHYQTLQKQINELQSSDEEILQLKAEAQALIERGKFVKADELLTRVSELALDKDVEDSLLTAAQALAARGAIKSIIFSYLEAAQFYEKTAYKIGSLNKPYLSIGYYLNLSSDLYRKAGFLEDSLILSEQALLEHSLKKKESVLFPEDFLNTLLVLAVNYQSLGKYKEAIELNEKALKISKEIYRVESPKEAMVYKNLALLYVHLGRYSEALPLYLKTIDIEKKFYEEHHDEYITTLNNLATLYKITKDYEKSLPLFLRILEIQEKKFGLNHPLVAYSLNNLASLYSNTTRYKESLALYHRSLEIMDRFLPQHHINRATIVNNLAGYYADTGEYKKAIITYQDSLNIAKKNLYPDHPTIGLITSNLASVYYSKGDMKTARVLYKKSLIILKEKLGDEHPNTQMVQEKLGDIKAKLNP